MKAITTDKDGYTCELSTNAKPGSILHEVVKQAEKHPEMMGGEKKGTLMQQMENESETMDYVESVLTRNAIYMKKLHLVMLEKIQILQDKIDEYTDPEKREVKVEKLGEKRNKLIIDLEVFESIYSGNETAQQKIEQLVFQWDNGSFDSLTGEFQERKAS